ncbi:MAG: OsmC family protein [Mariniblastus sp.]|nr:OsmC family protein [Mariniblastus sp.]
MKARVKWIDHMSFVGESGSGHSVVMDGSPDHGGRNVGVRPMEMILLGLGGCSAFDVIKILKKTRQRVVDCEVKLEAERSESVPSVFTKIKLIYVITGTDVSQQQADRAVKLSMEKYCSVTKMLEGTVKIRYEVQIVSA